MRIAKKLGPATLSLVALYLTIGAASASAFGTGVCSTTPEALTERCEAAAYYPAEEEFTGISLKNAVITDKTRTIECKKSEYRMMLDENPNNIGSVAIDLTKLTFGECELVTSPGTKCTLETPGEGEPKLPWSGSLLWSTFGKKGPNGSETWETASVFAKCGTAKCNYLGAGKEHSITGKFFNADDENKPVSSIRAEVQFSSASMESALECKGLVEFSDVYNVVPVVNEKQNVYISLG